MEKTEVKLLNKLTQQYLNNLHIDEKNRSGGFIFSPDSIWADGSDRVDGWCLSKNKGFSRQEVKKLYDQKELYIDENGVDDKFINDLTSEFKAGLFPSILIDWVICHICKLKKPEYITKFLNDFEYKEYFIEQMAYVLMDVEDADLIKLFIKNTRHYKWRYPYKKLKQTYKEIVKSNKAGV